MECEFSLDDIHKSVDLALISIRNEHEKVDAVFGDLSYLKRTVEKVLEPLNERVGIQRVSCLEDLRKLHAHCFRSARPNSEGKKLRLPTPPSSGRPLVRALSDGRLNGHSSSRFTSILQLKKRSSSASNAGNNFEATNYEKCNRDEVVSPPSNFRQIFRPTHLDEYKKASLSLFNKEECLTKPLHITERRKRMLKIRSSETRQGLAIHGLPDIKDFEMNRLIESFERDLRVLQETFSSFTQRVLLPLQTFCKQCKDSILLSTKERSKELKNVPSDAVSLGKTEFRIVQTLNQIKKLLWPNNELETQVHLFSNSHFSDQVEQEIDCTRYPIMRLIPDVLQKFNTVLSLASVWLKRDIMYVQCTKLALLRSHHRFLKTERLWRQARDSQRRLRGEWENVLGGLQSNTTRLNAVEDDVNRLNYELDKSNRARKVLEEKLLNTKNTVEPLVAKHRSLRKKSVVLSAKIEARERSHEFLQSRVLSLKADQAALSEKLRINEEYANKLQDKMEELYSLRDACSKLYEEKTNPEKLRSRLQLTKIRMPLPLLREKTFTLRTEEENVQRVLGSMEQYLIANKMHWSKLGSKLPWPGSSVKNPQKLPPIAQDDKASKGARFLEIEKRILSTYPDDEAKQRSLMLTLWAEENRNDGTLEKLKHALRSSDLATLADRVEREIMRRPA